MGNKRDAGIVSDLGLASYLKMRGFKVVSAHKRQVMFACEDNGTASRIENAKIEYVNSEFSRFDGVMMTLKIMPIRDVDVANPSLRIIDSLGLASFIKLRTGFRLVSRTAPNKFVFFVPVEHSEKFDEVHFDWANGELREFDASMMAIKSMRLTRP
jgi:hypothetical protein